MSKLKSHYAPTPSKIARHHDFYRRNKAEGKSINHYMAALRSSALHCEFKHLDDALLDRLVCRVNDLKLQCRLLAKPELMFQSALDDARAAEMSAKSLAIIQNSQGQQNNMKVVPVPSTEIHQNDVESESDAEELEEMNHLKEGRKKPWKTLPKYAGLCSPP